jgi:NAD(H)-dependent 7beta-hydroxy-3-oxo-delta4-cholenoic acid oxidoreductase
MKPLSKLFSPIGIGKMELKNRLVMAPMGNGMATDDGMVTQRLIDYLVARAKGGVGLIMLGSVPVDRDSPFHKSLTLWDDKFIPGFKEMAEAVHAYGAKLMPQLCYPGPGIDLQKFSGPSPAQISAYSLEDIGRIVQQFGDAVTRARKAGCDAVEIHAAHAWLVLGSFISSLRNRRTDAYGGSIEGRLKLPLEVITSVREREGPGFPVFIRISGDELVPGGRNLRETQYIAPILAQAGVDCFDISIGITGEPLSYYATGTPRGTNVALSKAVREAVDVPVMTVGRINDPRFAEDVLAKNEADLIIMGHALLADPELPNKAAEGNFEDIAPCIGCGLCMSGGREGTACLVNPALSREREMAITVADKKKKVLVAGGGLAGLEAAHIAALRGHEVTLCEKGKLPGGQFNLAAVAPMKQELCRVTKYFSAQAEKAGVRMQFGTEVTSELVAKVSPDVVIVATGGEPIVPDIPGVKGKRIVTAHDVLADKVAIGPGNVLVIGGGQVGCEVADLLADPGYNQPGSRTAVTIIEMLEDVALDMTRENRPLILSRMRDKEVKIITSATVKEFLEDGVVIVKDGQEQAIRGADSIILAVGTRPVDVLKDQVKDKVVEVYVIGDAKEPRNALDAVAEGAEVGRII